MGTAMKTPHVQEELRTSSFIVHLSRQAMFTPAESKQGLIILGLIHTDGKRKLIEIPGLRMPS